ncbi:hypothetical protein SAMN05216522_10796 [Rosenbergiella nectarea]|uniref:Uncharacterized protein n=1 Tax=Rosenbergiella nectarea TaxID=988801 RepID=A0A1H9JAN9_9GAMM|nr:hypothetical protein SAMN05216522_10796 [Rosenbergiella nectarea]
MQRLCAYLLSANYPKYIKRVAFRLALWHAHTHR